MLGSLLGHFLLRFGVTFVGLVPSSFLGARVSGYCCNVCVCRYMCSEFYLSSVWGILISFWSVLVFSLAFFWHFFSGTVCLSSFAFPGDFFSVFFSEELEAFCCRLRCCRFECVGLFASVVFARFSVRFLRVLCSTTGRRTCFRLLHFVGIQWPFQQLLRARLTSPSNEMAVVMAPVLHQSVPTFIAAFLC